MTGSNDEPVSLVQASKKVFDAMQGMGIRERPASLIPKVKEELEKLNRYLTGYFLPTSLPQVSVI